VPSFAQSLPVTVEHDTHDGVTVGVTVNGQPGAGATVTPDLQACAGIGESVPVCTPAVGDAIGPIGTANTAQSLPVPPVTLRHDENGTAAGVGDVGVVISPSGRVCPVVSTQSWQCIGGS
jgi:hypothetical protein